MMLVGSMASLSKLKVQPVFSASKQSLNLGLEELVTDIRSLEVKDCVVISFVNSVVNVYLVESN